MQVMHLFYNYIYIPAHNVRGYFDAFCIHKVRSFIMTKLTSRPGLHAGSVQRFFLFVLLLCYFIYTIRAPRRNCAFWRSDERLLKQVKISVIFKRKTFVTI